MAYMPRCFIGHNICSVQDTIDHSALQNNDSMMLFLDFKKVFDSVSHKFLFSLLTHVSLPVSYVCWIKIMYTDAFSVVRYKNWMTPPLLLGCGVWQGCPLSCHLFNLIGQVLIYYLRDAGFFTWWKKPGDPFSLYADDTAVKVYK